MKLENQVCSLELSKRLKELRVIKPSLFGWVHHNYGDRKEWILIKGTNDLKPIIWGGNDCKLQEQKDKEISAYTVSELGEMLPYVIEYKERKYWFEIGKVNKNNEYYEEHEANYTNGADAGIAFQRANTEADARAKLIIYLLEEKLMELPNE